MDFIEEAKKLGFSDAAVMKTDIRTLWCSRRRRTDSWITEKPNLHIIN